MPAVQLRMTDADGDLSDKIARREGFANRTHWVRWLVLQALVEARNSGEYDDDPRPLDPHLPPPLGGDV